MLPLSDQTVQFLEMLGTWFAGLCTAGTAYIALRLARRAERVKLQTSVGLYLKFPGDGTSSEECLAHVTNLGERPVTLVSAGWSIGKGKNRRLGMSPSALDTGPRKLEYGETVHLSMFPTEYPASIREFSTDFVRDAARRNIKTLRAQIHTSVHTEDVIPREDFLKRVKREIDNAGELKDRDD